jgi:pullulanase/glycogen debranching enzyme
LVKWFGQNGEILAEEQWNDPEQRTLMRMVKYTGADGTENTTLTVIHGAENQQEIALPGAVRGWLPLWHSADEVAQDHSDVLAAGTKLTIGPSAMMVFAAAV